jgi:1,3-beta-glucan synthase
LHSVLSSNTDRDCDSQPFLELWDASHAVLGVIAIVAIQRAIHKILIAVVFTSTDETIVHHHGGLVNGTINSAISQPARE